MAVELEKAGAAALDLSQCIQESPGAGFDPMYYPEGWTLYASRAVKQAVSIPVINSHSFRNPDFCDKVLADGDTDMVGLSRQMLCDPYWALKAYLGRDDQIRRCISCLTGCWQESMMAKKEIGCAINPACGHMEFDEMTPAANPLKVGIVGGGPAGMEAARIAASRGHHVTLFEKTGELGGAILGCCMAPGKEKMKWYADWIRGQIRRLEVDVRLHTAPTVDDLRGFDIVLNATGASSYVPDCIGAERVVPFEEAIACPKVDLPLSPQRPADAPHRPAGAGVGRPLRGGRHRRRPGRHGQGGHHRHGKQGVRRFRGGDPHVRAAQAVCPDRRGGPPQRALQVPGEDHREQHGVQRGEGQGGADGQVLPAHRAGH